MSTYANIEIGYHSFCICNDGYPSNVVPWLASLIEKSKESKYSEATFKGLLLEEDDVYLGTAYLESYNYTVEKNIISIVKDKKQFKVEVKGRKIYSNGIEISNDILSKF